MLQSIYSVFVVYRRKTLTGSPDPMHANGMDKPCSNTGLSGKVTRLAAVSLSGLEFGPERTEF